jgi:hypothetical protein
MPFLSPITLKAGTQVTIIAIPDAEYEFSYWIGLSSSGSSYTFGLDNNYTSIDAVFIKTSGTGSVTVYTLSPGTTVYGSVTISIDGNAAVPFTTPVRVAANTPVVITAIVDTEYTFSYWSSFATLNQSYTFNAENSISDIFAVFVKTSGSDPDTLYTVTPTTPSNGSLTISIDGGPAISFTSPITLKEGTPVTITAIPDSTDYVFSYWIGIVAGNNPGLYAMNDNVTVGAVLVDINGAENTDYFIVTYNATMENGKVMWSLTGNDGEWWEFPGSDINTGVFEKIFPYGTNVFLKAFADNGYKFTDWTGDIVAGSPNPYEYTGYESITVGASFAGEIKKGLLDDLNPLLLIIILIIAAMLVVLFLPKRRSNKK